MPSSDLIVKEMERADDWLGDTWLHYMLLSFDMSAPATSTTTTTKTQTRQWHTSAFYG